MKMRFNIFWVALLAAATFSCERDPSPEQADRFIKFYGEYLMDEARDLAVLDDGGYAICGVDSLPDLGKRMVLVITDEYGNMRSGFPKYYTVGELNSAANSIVPIRGGQGGFLLAGYIEQPVEGSFNTQRDIFLVKVSSTGDSPRPVSFGTEDDEVILSVAQGLVSGYILAGYKVRDGKTDILVMGVDQELNQWDLPFNLTPRFSKRRANFILNAGDRYLCACVAEEPGDFSGDTKTLLLSFNDDLNPIPEYLSSGSPNEGGISVVGDGPNTYLVLGTRIISGNSEIVVFKVETNDSDLRPSKSLLLTPISESGVDLRAKGIVKTADGKYAIVGTREASGNQQIFLQFLDSDYDPEDLIIYGAAGDQSAADIVLAEDDGIVLLGTNSVEESSMISLIKTNGSGGL